MPQPEIEILPGGFITSRPRHKIGPKGASPFLTNPFTIEGFENLICYYGEIAYPLLNSSGDINAGGAHPYFGNDLINGPDGHDLTAENVMVTLSQMNQQTRIINFLNVNGEFYDADGSRPQDGTMVSEEFTTLGTVTVTAGSNIIAGAGTAWTTDVLAGGYGLVDLNLNKIVPGDVIVVEVTPAVRYVQFRIIQVTNATHLVVWPTPGASNPALGAGKNYKIVRTGYGSYSRAIDFNVPDGSGISYTYYAGNLWNNLTAPNFRHGVIQAISNTSGAILLSHYMSPGTVDSAGTKVGNIMADDVIYYKGYLLYGAGPAVSWSIPGFPSALPFGQTDFPARNTSIVDASSTFVSFERIGDQLVALFEDSTWLVSPTGSDPAFAFYQMPELISIINPGTLDTTGVQRLSNYGRQSTSGRGAIFYISNRGLEVMGGGLANETSAPISTALRALFGQVPLYVGWDSGTDVVLIRSAFFNIGRPKGLIFNPAQGEWSTLVYLDSSGGPVVGLTPSIQTKIISADHTRLIHYGYYEKSLTTFGTIFYVAALMDENTPQEGRATWQWVTPVIPLGLEYPTFSTGGIIFDAYSLNTSATVTWKAYGGSSPYSMTLRDSGSMVLSGLAVNLLSPWTSTRQRFGKKMDDPFVMFVLTGTSWVAPVALRLFDSSTQAKR